MGIATTTYQKVLKRDEHRCVRCYSNQNLTVHHIKHREYGGTDALENLTVLCFSCHRDWHKKFERCPLAKFSKYIEPENVVDILIVIREMHQNNNNYRNYTICNANSILPKGKKKKPVQKQKRRSNRS